jgi:hypothetical protein
MKTLFLALALVLASAVSSMAGPHANPYLCHVIDGQLPDGQIC